MRKTIIFTLFLIISLLISGCQNQKKMTVNFMTNGGNQIPQITTHLNTDFNESYVPYKEGFIFIGWYTDQAMIESYQDKTFKNKQEITLYAKWRPKSNGEIDEVTLFEQAYINMQSANTFLLEISGKIDPNVPMIAKQDLKAVKIKDKDTYYNYTVSKGTVTTFYEIYGTFEQSTLKKGNKVDDKLNPISANSQEEINLETFKEIYGILPYELNYIVNKQTVIGITDSTQDETGYHFTLVLDNELSSENYKKNIVATNTAKSELPVFEQIKLKVSIDKEGFFTQIIYQEIYKIRIQLPVIGFSTQKITTEIKETFTNFNQEVHIKPYDI